MLATYPKFRHLGVGSALMEEVDRLARQAGGKHSEQHRGIRGKSRGAQTLSTLGLSGYRQASGGEHPSHHYRGHILLLVREVP